MEVWRDGGMEARRKPGTSIWPMGWGLRPDSAQAPPSPLASSLVSQPVEFHKFNSHSLKCTTWISCVCLGFPPLLLTGHKISEVQLLVFESVVLLAGDGWLQDWQLWNSPDLTIHLRATEFAFKTSKFKLIRTATRPPPPHFAGFLEAASLIKWSDVYRFAKLTQAQSPVARTHTHSAIRKKVAWPRLRGSVQRLSLRRLLKSRAASGKMADKIMATFHNDLLRGKKLTHHVISVLLLLMQNKDYGCQSGFVSSGHSCSYKMSPT